MMSCVSASMSAVEGREGSGESVGVTVLVLVRAFEGQGMFFSY